MKFAGILEAGRIDGVLTDSKWVKGTYIAVSTIDERNSIPSGVRVVGTKCHVAEGRGNYPAGEYMWDGSAWEYVGPGITFSDLEKDNWHIYGRRKLKADDNAQWVQIDSTYILDMIRDKLREELDTIYAKKSELETEVANLNNLIVNVDEKVGKIETSITELLGEDGKSGTIKDLQDSLKQVTSQVEEFGDRITQAINTAETAKSTAEAVETKLNSKDFEVPVASTSKVGGIKSAGGISPEDKGSRVRYYIDVQDAGDKSGLAYVDVNPTTATVDEESLKKALTPEVIDEIGEKVWPDVKEKIDQETWGDSESMWIISGGDAGGLK